MDDDLIFEYGEGTDAYGGCGATLMGEMWYFGGVGSYMRQVRFIIFFKVLCNDSLRIPYMIYIY